MKQRPSSRWIRTCAVLLVLFAAANATTVSGDDPATVLIIVNDATPPEAGTNGIGASVWVGQHYAAARGIPTSNIFHMNYAGGQGPQDWGSYYLDWNTYVAQIRDPLRQFMASTNLTNKINYIVPTYGVPYKTEIGKLTDQTNLSIDSYLATLNSDASNTSEINPYQAAGYADLTRPHFRDYTNTEGTKIYIVSRLDGPSAVEAAGLVDKAMSAEQSLQVGSGMSYFDTYGGTTGGAVSFDNAYHATLAAGFPSTENTSGSLTTHAPITQFAWGWYGNDTGAYNFLNGAVGAQLTSYTANQIRVAGGVANWVPNWIHAGVTATWGATGEPYTNGYTMGDVLLNEFYHGYNFGESALLATPYLHWMMIFVGDPLYAPKIFQNVPPPPPQIPVINYFNASHTTISPGQWTQLIWSVSGATSVTIDNGIGNAPEVLVSPTTTTTYTLTASSSAGSSTAKLTITVTGSAPTISSFTASPTSITSGGSSILSWSVSGATSVTLNQGIGDVTSLTSKSVSPLTTSTYTLTATNSSGSVTASATVTISAPPPTISSFTTNPPGLGFTVDGVAYTSAQNFSWAPGSVHTLAVNSPQNGTASTRYAWANWNEGGAMSHTVTASGSPATYTANFATQYSLTLSASPGGGTVAANPSPPDGFYNSGTSVQLTATANSGYQFGGFSGDLSGTSNPQSVVMSAPRSVTAGFNPLNGVVVSTSPPGLSVTVDGVAYTSAQNFSWATGSVHTLAVSSPQNGTAGTRYAWANWNDGGAMSHTVTASGSPATYTANFATRYSLTLSASPGGGGTLAANPSSPDGFYNSGASVQLTATANSGYQFGGFSGALTSASSPQSVVMSAPRSLTGTFTALSGAVVSTNPPGLSFTVDGVSYTSAQNFSWAPSSVHTLAVNSPQNGTAGTRYAWANWNDGGAMSHTVTASGSPATYTANFATQYSLTATPSPGGGGTLAATPSSPDGFYNSGTSVQLTATANSGYQFGGYSGDLSGASNPQSVVMSAPRSVTAAFNPLTGVVVSTNPPGLSVTVDGVAYTSAQNFSWAPGSVHTLAVNSLQNGTAGTRYAWANWNEGGAMSHTVTASGSPATYTANFAIQYSLMLTASPGGGMVAANPSPPDGFYNGGTSVQLTATANSGYQFGGFSGDLSGTSNPQSIVMSAPRSVTGNFIALSGAVVSTNPPGLSFTVDGVSYTSAQNFSWATGSVHTLAVSSPQNGTAGTRYVWANWNDGGAISHTVTVTNATALYTANFATQYSLALSAKPNGGGSLAANPTSADGYYANGTSVQITAAATSGFTFKGFSGDLAGSTNPQSIAMTAPRSVTGSFSGFSTLTSTLTVDRAKLNFGTANGIVTSPQTIRVNIAAGVSWSASSNQPNISVYPSSGIGSGTFQVAASAGPGGVVTVSSSGASGSPQIQVNVTTVIPGASFGSFDTPTNNATGVAGAIAVTGWALDNVQVAKVDIWREPVAGEGTDALVYVGDAVFVEGARPDIEGLYPTLPFNYRAGWGYQMLTNSRPGGDGPFKLHAIAHNKAGSSFDLGTKTITLDNVHASKPFGSIDTPGQGETASGNAYANFGWALAKNPNQIPIDGSTISVVIDGQVVGHPTYNQFRSDIPSLFPGYANSLGAVGLFYLDTTKLVNGVHTISWNVFDSAGHGEGIGSRYFSVFNSGNSSAGTEEPMVTEETGNGAVTVRERFPENSPNLVEIEEVGQLELPLRAISGYEVVNGDHHPLPIGSSLRRGVFYWQPGPGFLGEYHLVFERKDGTETRVRVTIRPKTYPRGI